METTNTNPAVQPENTSKKDAKSATRIYNLIVLDESGSMDDVRANTISGCNETINLVKSEDRDGLSQYISIYAFQTDNRVPSRYLVKNVPASACEPITKADYEPNGCTPLFDAIGATMVDLRATVDAHPGAIGAVTIITDGYENSSTHYTLHQVGRLINAAKEAGWSVSFMGANIDTVAVGVQFCIEPDACVSWTNDQEGTDVMFERTNKARKSHFKKVREVGAMPCCAAERLEGLKKAAKGNFEDM